MNRFRPKLSLLPPAQRRLWPRLAPATDLGFVLYGGTAIALRLGHRQSADFDLFTDGTLDQDALAKSFSFLRSAAVLNAAPNTLTVSVTPKGSRDRVKVSFFGGIDFGRFGEPDLTRDGVLQVASLDDLLATKLKTVLQRAEIRDYRDIAAMVAAGIDVSRGLSIACGMFGPTFSPMASLKALTYHEDGDLPRLSRRERRTLIEAAARVTELPPVRLLSNRLAADAKEAAATRSPPARG